MTDKTTLGDRMKGYEYVSQFKLLRRTPVIIRVDGKAFHTFTKRFKDVGNDPFSSDLHHIMVATAIAMCQHMQNAQFAYTQSDEISLFLRDWDKVGTQQWFDAKVQKMVSVSAAMATAYFNFFLGEELRRQSFFTGDLPLFDSRAYNLPKEEVCNYFIWRQQDASRNSVQMFGRHFFSSKQMHGKSNSEVQDMLMEAHGVNWNDIDTWKKRGCCVVPNPNRLDSSTAWIADDEIPIFTQDREYVDRFLIPEEGDA